MEAEGSTISLWVCREEKLVFGLSKRTTCADVVKVLLEDRSSQHGLPSAACPQAYCIVEKWRGFERMLPNKTKLLRLWLAWAEEQSNVKFVLVKSEASLANHGARSAEARVVLSKVSPCVTHGTARSPTGGIPPEKQRRVVRKAFRKLEKIRRKRVKRNASTAEQMETLVHLVISQDHTIRQQIQRITQLDADIDTREAQVHRDRVQRHGLHYVQDAYSGDAAAASARDGDDGCSSEALADFEESVRQREEAAGLREELWGQEALIDTLTAQLQEELNRRWTQRSEEGAEPGEGAPSRASSEADPSSEEELFGEEERIRTQLEASSDVALRLNADLEASRSELELSQELCGAREKEVRDLLETIHTLHEEEGTVREESRGHGTEDTGG